LPAKKKWIFPRPTGAGLLALFLLLTLALSIWLGYQALDAARSHRRTAEGVLSDYAGIAAGEYSRRIQENLAEINRWIFDDVPRSYRRRPPHPEVMVNDLGYALRGQECACDALRADARFFSVDLRDSTVVSAPDTLPSSVQRVLAQVILGHRIANPESRITLLTLPKASLLDSAAVLIYSVSRESEGLGELAYGMVARTNGLGELFSTWFARGSVLPTSISAGQANDSLLEIAVHGSNGIRIFESPTHYPNAFSSQDTLPPEFGSLAVRAAIRPDAAQHLIIGGLPSSRIPLLLVLMALTLGVGGAALLQIRREHHLALLRDDFISSVSHEFRTPLTQIRIFSELLDDGKLKTDEERKRSIGVINREARRLTHLVENILQFSHSRRTPGPAGDLEGVLLNDTLEEVTDAFGPQAEAREAIVLTEAEADLWVMANRGGLHRVVANLLDNALKYGPKGQTVRIRAQTDMGKIRLSVEDQGPGIAFGDRDKIWDPYRRLEADISGNIQGSGIGLAVVAELSSHFGGSAWVEEGEERGSRFVVELPQARMDENEFTHPVQEA